MHIIDVSLTLQYKIIHVDEYPFLANLWAIAMVQRRRRRRRRRRPSVCSVIFSVMAEDIFMKLHQNIGFII